MHSTLAVRFSSSVSISLGRFHHRRIRLRHWRGSRQTHESERETGSRHVRIARELTHQDTRVVSAIGDKFADMHGCASGHGRIHGGQCASGWAPRTEDKDGPASSRVSRAETSAGTRVARTGTIQRVMPTISAQLLVGERREQDPAIRSLSEFHRSKVLPRERGAVFA